MANIEYWIDIPEYEGFYKISSLGSVKSLDRIVVCRRWGTQRRKGKLLSLNFSNPHGYITVVLSKNGRPRTFRLHRLILKCFIGEPFSKNVDGMHLDGDKTNNILANLRWGSKVCNQAFRIDDGTSMELEKHPMTNLKNQDVLNIVNRIENGDIQKQIAQDYNVSPSTIYAINNGQNWSELTGIEVHNDKHRRSGKRNIHS
ncbi:MAG: NUMOD4 domain-containing protein [Alphaproteobacteria bacterium]